MAKPTSSTDKDEKTGSPARRITLLEFYNQILKIIKCPALACLGGHIQFFVVWASLIRWVGGITHDV